MANAGAVAMSRSAAMDSFPSDQSNRRSSWPTPNNVPRGSAPAIQTTGFGPCASTASRKPSGRFSGWSVPSLGGIECFHAGTESVDARAITVFPSGQSVDCFSRIRVRFSTSSIRAVAAVFSAGGNSPGRTTMMASRRSICSLGRGDPDKALGTPRLNACLPVTRSMAAALAQSVPPRRKFRLFILGYLDFLMKVISCGLVCPLGFGGLTGRDAPNHPRERQSCDREAGLHDEHPAPEMRQVVRQASG